MLKTKLIMGIKKIQNNKTIAKILRTFIDFQNLIF